MWWQAVLALLLIGTTLVAIGLAEATQKPIKRQHTLLLTQWPIGARPLRIALLSDIHLGNRAMSQARLSSIVQSVNDEHPDLVLIAGDFVVGHEADKGADLARGLRQPLSELHPRLGTIAVLGNHDYWTSPTAIRAALQAAGVVVLDNTAIRRGPVAVIGIGDAFSGHSDVEKAQSAAVEVGGIPVVLTHAPDVERSLPPFMSLVLAGHTHCGQIVLPGFGPVLTRSPVRHWKRVYDPQLRCGIVRDDGHLVIVTAGLGSGSVPIRLGAAPDWWLLTLQGRKP